MKNRSLLLIDAFAKSARDRRRLKAIKGTFGGNSRSENVFTPKTSRSNLRRFGQAPNERRMI